MSPLSLDEDTRTHTHSSGTFDSCPPICGAPPGAQVLSLVFSLPTLHHASRTRHTHAQHVRCPPPCRRRRRARARVQVCVCASLCRCRFVVVPPSSFLSPLPKTPERNHLRLSKHTLWGSRPGPAVFVQ